MGLVLSDGRTIAQHGGIGDRRVGAEPVRTIRSEANRVRGKSLGSVGAEMRRVLEQEEFGYRLRLPRESNAAVAAMLEKASRMPFKEWSVVLDPGNRADAAERRSWRGCAYGRTPVVLMHSRECLIWKRWSGNESGNGCQRA